VIEDPNELAVAKHLHTARITAPHEPLFLLLRCHEQHDSDTGYEGAA
jgi:hypothetical protein